jgi:hypothetical protein
MVQSRAVTVEEYLANLPEERRAIIATVRDVVRRNIPDGYREGMAWGMIMYFIPLERYPDTYNGQPLGYVSLAAQKNHYALYLMGAYMDAGRAAAIAAGFAKAGKKLDMGKSCVRFRRLDDLPLDVIGDVVASMPVDEYLRMYEACKGPPADQRL